MKSRPAPHEDEDTGDCKTFNKKIEVTYKENFRNYVSAC